MFAHYFSLILVYSIIVCSHIICTCTSPFIFHWVAFWRP